MKNIIVTGGAGFIGSHLIKRLLDEGNKVTCVDNLFTGNLQNIKPFEVNEKFDFKHHDITKPFYVEDKVDQVYNLACPASPIHYQYNPIKTIKTSVQGTINFLGLAKKHNARFFQASTSEVYGDPDVHPQPESYWGNVNTIGIRSCYDEGKRVAETLCFDYHREHKLDIRVIRIFNTYGPNMHPNDGRVVSNFIVQALKGEDITIYGDGSQTRSFCYVDDLVDAFIRFMNQDEFVGPLNAGNPGEFTIKELAEKVISITKSQSKLVYKDLPQDDPRQRRPDITKASELLGWKPLVEIDDGIKKSIPYFLNEISS